jgi:type IV pilus assembly protein PilM
VPLLDKLQRWIKEPPPDYLFELTERGVAWTLTREPAQARVQLMPDKIFEVSPSAANLLRWDVFKAILPKMGNGGPQTRAKAALAIPDYATRMAVLDFEEFPSDEQQRLALVKFRLRKSVPFPIDEAQLSCSVQVDSEAQSRVEVLAVAIARPILEEYEQVLRQQGFQVGVVVPSSLAALGLCPREPEGLTLFARAAGMILSLVLLEQNHLRLVRCIDLSSETELEAGIAAVTTLLQQTVAYAEDELGQRVRRLVLCGFGGHANSIGAMFQDEFGLTWEPLRSRFGAVSQENAGLLGLAEQYAA